MSAAPVPGEDYTLLNAEDAPASARFAVSVTDRECAPYLLPGDTAYGAAGPVRDGEAGFFLLEGQMLLRQYHRDALGVVYLFTLNRAFSARDEALFPGDGRRAYCCGRLLGVEDLPIPGEI